MLRPINRKKGRTRKFKALLETQAERKMKCTGRTRVRDPNQYRQTDTQLLGSIHLRFVHRFTFFPPAHLSLSFRSAKFLKCVALSEAKRKENPVVPLSVLRTPPPTQSDSSPPQSPASLSPLMKPNELPY